MINRRQFVTVTGAAALTNLLGSSAPAGAASGEDSPPGPASTATVNGLTKSWTIGRTAARTTFGDSWRMPAIKPEAFISVRKARRLLVYDKDGKLLRTICNEYPEVHSLFHVEENGQEYFYCTVQKGTPKKTGSLSKSKPTDVVQKIFAPPKPDFMLGMMAAYCRSSGSGRVDLYCEWLWRFAHVHIRQKRQLPIDLLRRGTEDGKCNCCHGVPWIRVTITAPARVRPRKPSPQPFDLDGKFVRT